MADQKQPDGEPPHGEAVDPADRAEPSLQEAADEADVPEAYRAPNAGGTMSETARSRDRDLDDELP